MKKKLAEPHDYDPESVAYLQKKLKSKNLKPNIRLKIAEKLKSIDLLENTPGKAAKKAPSDSDETGSSKSGKRAGVTKKTKSSEAETSKKLNEPVINPEIYKEAFEKVQSSFSVIFDKVKQNIDYAQVVAQENVGSIDPNAIRNNLMERFGPLMNKLSLAGLEIDMTDSDNDGIPDALEADADADGIPDILEDEDHDGVPDFVMGDWDGDGIPDILEDFDFSVGEDTPEKCAPSDDDCISANIPRTSMEKLAKVCPDMDQNCLMRHKKNLLVDSDGDGVPDFLEGDIDGDGIADHKEVDSDGDGQPNYLDDEDLGGSMSDEDGDGVYDMYTEDSDKDGVLDVFEDEDGDGVLDFLQVNSDGQEAEGEEDDDSRGNDDDENVGDDNDDNDDDDGDDDDDDDDNDDYDEGEELADDGDVADDGDGGQEEPASVGGDPPVEISADDEDGDGIPDYLEEDFDENGIPDYLEDEDFMSVPANRKKYGPELDALRKASGSGGRKILSLSSVSDVHSVFGLLDLNRAREIDEEISYEMLAHIADVGSNTLKSVKTTFDGESKDSGRPGSVDSTQEKVFKQDEKVEISKQNVEPSFSVFDEAIKLQLDAILSLLYSGSIDAALSKCESLIPENPYSGRLYLLKGIALEKQAEKKRSNEILQKAINEFKTAAKLPQSSPYVAQEAYTKAASSTSFLGRTASPLLKEAVKSFPENQTLVRKLVVAFLTEGKNDAAVKFIKERLSKDPDDAFLLVHLGFVHNQRNQFGEAIETITKGLISTDEAAVHDGRFYNSLGNAYLRTARPEKALEWFSKGADRGVFLSKYQRSLYNADHPLRAQAWWTAKEAGPHYVKAVQALEGAWKDIQKEALSLLDAKSGLFEKESEGLSKEGDWRQFTLYIQGRKMTKNCEKTPKTCAILDKIPDATSCKRGQIKFSIMQPETYVWPHTGPTNCRLRMHLGLIVPEGPAIRVASDTRKWEEGKVIIFDDSFEHEVWHNGTSQRLVLIVDMWHPDLNAGDKRSLTPI